MTNAGTVDAAIEADLMAQLASLEAAFGADVLFYRGGIVFGVDDFIRDAVDAIAAKKLKMLFVLETGGGSIDVTERIARTLRNNYAEIDFLIPNYAYSAGTILAMSGDSIHMDSYSVLGPIDPQVYKQGVGWVPALGYLEKYDELVEKSRQGTLTSAEAAFLIQKFDPAELHAFEQAKNHSITLLKEWLVKFKFKDWVTTETQGVPVTPKMKQDRAEDIAKTLNDTKLWHSHGRGIPMRTLQDEVNLKIEDFGTLPANPVIRRYYKLTRDHLARIGASGVLHTRTQFKPHNF